MSQSGTRRARRPNRAARHRPRRIGRVAPLPRLCHELVEGQVGRHGHRCRGHGVPHPAVPQRAAEQRIGALGACGLDEEPAHEHEPDPAEVAAAEQPQQPDHDEDGAEHAAGGRGLDGRSDGVTGAVPDPRLEDPATVQRQGGNQVEAEHDQVDAGQVPEDALDTVGQVEPRRHVGEEAQADGERRDHRAHHRNPEGSARRTRMRSDAGHTAEQPQGDALDGYPLAQRPPGVPQLVQEDAGEEQDGGHDSHRQMGTGTEIGIRGGKHSSGQRPHHDPEHDQPRPARTDLDAADPGDAKARLHLRLLSATPPTRITRARRRRSPRRKAAAS